MLTAENAVELCQQLFEEPKEYIDGAAQRRRWTCVAKKLQNGVLRWPTLSNADLKAAYARNLPYEKKTEAIAMLREAACAGQRRGLPADLSSYHRSWDRGDLDKVPLVTARRGGPGPAQGRRTRAPLLPRRRWHVGLRTATSSNAIPSPRDTGRNVPSPTSTLQSTRAEARPAGDAGKPAGQARTSPTSGPAASKYSKN